MSFFILFFYYIIINIILHLLIAFNGFRELCSRN